MSNVVKIRAATPKVLITLPEAERDAYLEGSHPIHTLIEHLSKSWMPK